MHGAPYPANVPARTAVLTLPAEIDITNARSLCGEVGSALVSGATVVVADLTSTTFCDSAGARILVLAWEQAAVNGIELRIVVPSATVRRGFALMGLEGFLPFYPSLSAALTAEPARASAARPWLGRSRWASDGA
jgi:anti-sigma B factor antagonist